MIAGWLAGMLYMVLDALNGINLISVLVEFLGRCSPNTDNRSQHRLTHKSASR